ncbi:DEAD/DEAH box helicase family protein [Phyllobacterium sp. 628]|uniref:DEAD/DEAH box helicase n=1 Tax=Phyllobacterium sp. 628 TaxID=2718938 RepID=UPI0016623179|nr:DEAD/DEAH box helicase family protein [Phyllobacterium sp. 628]QND53442.1 DEAD/DEAH box helicase family protein [Phyllobacterium sp. 628]
MISLRPDQEDVRTKLRVALRSSSSVLTFAPTGFGKTVLAAALIKMIFAAGKRVIFCVHRVDLIVQTAKTFEKFGIPFSYIAAGHHYNPYHRVYIASIATLRNRLGKIPAHYVMVDEAHLSAATGWAAVALHYKETGAKLIGYTGSPERLDGKPLGDVWDTMVLGPSMRWLIDNEKLSRYRPFAPAGLDTSGLHSRGNEFIPSELEELMAGKAVIANAVKHWKNIARGKRTIGFAPSVALAEKYAAEFRDKGVMAVALDGNTPQPDRKSAFVGFADRQIEIIFNCGLFCEGFDLSAQVDRDVTIECTMDNSPSQSLAKVLQKWGRCLRWDGTGIPHIILDMVGGFARHGFPDDDREWSLEGRKTSDSSVDILTCPKCFATHALAPRCTECGHVYPVKERASLGVGRILNEVDAAIVEIDPAAERREREASRREQAWALADDVLNDRDPKLSKGMKSQLEALIKQATAKGFKSPEKWAAHIITARQAKAAERNGAGS